MQIILNWNIASPIGIESVHLLHRTNDHELYRLNHQCMWNWNLHLAAGISALWVHFQMIRIRICR